MSDRSRRKERSLPIRGELVRELRLHKGWSAAQLASHAGLSKRLIEQIEQTENKPVYPSTLETIAAKLTVDPQRLIAESAMRPAEPPIDEERPSLPPGGLAISVHMPSEDVADPALVTMFCQIFQEAMIEYESNKSKFMHSPDVDFYFVEELIELWEDKGITVDKILFYYVPVVGSKGEKLWCYGLLPETLHDKFLSHMKQNDQVIDEFLIVVHGKGEPSPSHKATVKHYYGFDHDKFQIRKPR